MNSIKHTKIKNTGLLFEVLARRITADIINERTCNLLPVLKKYFSEGKILSKELDLYNILIRERNEDYNYAKAITDAVLDARSKLSLSEIKREKYNLIKELQSLGYDVEELMNINIPNYKQYASIYKVFRGIDNQLNNDAKYLMDYVENVNKIVEHIQNKNVEPITENSEDNDMFDNYKKQDKITKLISYNMVVKEFNEKYKDVSPRQKELMKRYINNNLKYDKSFPSFVIEEIKITNQKIEDFIESLENDDVLKIKLSELKKELDKKDVDNIKKVDDVHVKLLMNLYYLCEDIGGIE